MSSTGPGQDWSVHPIEETKENEVQEVQDTSSVTSSLSLEINEEDVWWLDQNLYWDNDGGRTRYCCQRCFTEGKRKVWIYTEQTAGELTIELEHLCIND